MAEIKHTFTSGRMNKDLDERLIPNGEYRDALNIKVSSSAGSDVGAVEGLLGNIQISQLGIDNASAIGAIKDTTNNKIYWFITSSSIDSIFEQNILTNTFAPVIVDLKSKQVTTIKSVVSSDLSNDIIFEDINNNTIKKIIGNDLPSETDEEALVLNNIFVNIPDIATNISIPKNTVLKKNENGFFVFKNIKYNNKKIQFNNIEFVYYSNNILNFSKNNLITGINIIDGLLFFTDNVNAPRRINIKDFVTFSNGIYNAKTKVKYKVKNKETNQILEEERVFTEDDISVAKKAPFASPDMELFDSLIEGTTEISNLKNLFGIKINDIIDLKNIGLTLSWQAEDIIEISSPDDSDVTITTQVSTVLNDNIELKVISIEGDIADKNLNYNFELLEKDSIYKLGFVRFAYRWKYKDGEYSAISPFTVPAFIPGTFLFDGREAYNKAMSNKLQKVILSNFNLGDSNVEKIDILFKETRNNNIYVLQSINKEDFNESFEIKKEQIHSVLPNDQLLRQWDNVPRKAKAQEITANRIIYGNYVQNFDIFTDPKFKIESYNRNALFNRSIKSNRTYQVGVVYMDDYNRHSPILSNDSGSYTINYQSAGLNTGLSIKMTTPPPAWAKYYKYYIKDVSGEYYNLAADKFYKDELTNFVYVSFPSTDRNKIDKDSYLHLKKYHGSDKLQDSPVKYKVIDIFNEPPEVIHEKLEQIGAFENVLFAASYGDNATVATKTAGGTPVENNTKIQIRSINTTGTTSGEAGTQGVDSDSKEFLKGGTYARFYINNKKSKTYKIASTRYHFDGGSDEAEVKFEKPFGPDVNFIYTDPELSNSPIKPNVAMRFYKDAADAGDPEFNGRFFVKLRNDFTLDDAIKKQPATDDDGVKYFEAYSVLFDGLDRNNYNYAKSGSEPRISPTPVHVKAGGTKVEGSRSETGKRDLIGSKKAHITFEQTGPSDDSSFLDNITVGTKLRFSNHSTIYRVGVAKHETISRKKGPSHSVKVVKMRFEDEDGKETNLTHDLVTDRTNLDPNFLSVSILIEEDEETVLFTSNPAVFETEPKEQKTELDIYYETEKAFPISEHGNFKELEWYNAFSFNNGVESNRIRDDFNGIFIDTGVRASSVIEEQFKEEHKFNGIIWSGIINSRSGVNQSNQFNAANPITKDLLPSYGPIQKMHAWDDQLVMLCENKIVRAWADKDQLFNADGSTNLIASNSVIGSVSPYNGDYGISNNPESFASYGFRCYFTDKKRGAVLRLSKDGLTAISAANMSTFFEDRLYGQTRLLLGSFDENNKLYNITFSQQDTLCFSEAVNGWVTRKSYMPDHAISLNGKYYTFKKNEIWEHDRKDAILNTFYGDSITSSGTNNSAYSKIVFELNDDPSIIKKFKTLSYEGDKGWNAKIETDQQKSSTLSFKEKENKYFSNITGESKNRNNLDLKNISFQGIGKSVPASDAEYTDQIGNVNNTISTVVLSANSIDSLPINIKDIKSITINKKPGEKTSSFEFYIYPQEGYYIVPNSLEYSNIEPGSSMLFEYIDDYAKITLSYELIQGSTDQNYNFLVLGKTLQKEVVVEGTYTYNLPSPWQLDFPLTGTFRVKGLPGEAGIIIKSPTVFLGNDDLDLHLIEFNSTNDSDITIEANSNVKIAVSKQNNNAFKVTELITLPKKSIQNFSYVVNVKSTEAPPVINYLIRKTFNPENFTLSNLEETVDLKILANINSSYNIKFERTAGSPIEIIKEQTIVHTTEEQGFEFVFPESNLSEIYKITISENTNTQAKDSFGDKIVTFSRAAKVQKEANLLIKYNQNSNTTLTYNAFVGESINSKINFSGTNYITLPVGTYIIPKSPLSSDFVNFGKNKNNASIDFTKFEFDTTNTNRLIIEGIINIENITENETYILDLTKVLGASITTTFDYSIVSGSGNYTDSPTSYTDIGPGGLIKNPDLTQYLFTLTPSSNFVFKETISGSDFEIVDSSNTDVSSLYALTGEIKLLKENNLIKVGFDTKSYTVPLTASTIFVRPKQSVVLTEADVSSIAKKYILDIELTAESTQSNELTYTENFAKTFKNIDSASTNILYQFVYNDKELSNLRPLLNNNIIGAIHSGQFSNFVFSNTNNTQVTLVSSSGGTFTNTDGNSVTVAGPYSYDSSTKDLTVNLLINLTAGGNSVSNKVSLKILFDHLKQYNASNNLIDKYKLISIYPGAGLTSMVRAGCENTLKGTPSYVGPDSFTSIDPQDNKFPKFWMYNGAPLAKGQQIFAQKENEVAPGSPVVWFQTNTKNILVAGDNTLYNVGQDNLKRDGIILESKACPLPSSHISVAYDGTQYVKPTRGYYPDVITHKLLLHSTIYKDEQATVTGEIINITSTQKGNYGDFYQWAVVTGQVKAAKDGLPPHFANTFFPGLLESTPLNGLTITSITASSNKQNYTDREAYNSAGVFNNNPLAVTSNVGNVKYKWKKSLFFNENGVAEMEWFSYRGKAQYSYMVRFDNRAATSPVAGFGYQIPFMARRSNAGISDKYDVGPSPNQVNKYEKISNTCFQDLKLTKFGANNPFYDANPYCPPVGVPENPVFSDKYLINDSTDDLIALRNGSGDIQQIGARPYGNYNMVTSFGLMFNNSGNKLNFEKDPSEGNKIRSIDREVKYAYIKIDNLTVYTDPEYSFKNLIDPTENPPFEAIGLDGPTVLNINGQKYAKIVFFNTNNTYNIKYHPERVLNKNIIFGTDGSTNNFIGSVIQAGNIDHTENSNYLKDLGKWIQGNIYVYGYKAGSPGDTTIDLGFNIKNYEVGGPSNIGQFVNLEKLIIK